MRPPDPTEIIRVGPIAISVEILSAPNILVVILDVVLEPLREILLTLANPIVNRIACGDGRELPVAHVLAGSDELSRTAVAQRKPGRVGINSSAAAIAHSQTDSPIARHVDPV
jgi:hypothetical protein